MSEARAEQRKISAPWLGFIPVMSLVAAFIGGFYVMQYRQNAQAADIDRLNGKATANQTAITTLQANVSEVKNDVSDIKDDVKDIQVEQVAQGKLLERILAEVSDGPRPRPN